MILNEVGVWGVGGGDRGQFNDFKWGGGGGGQSDNFK